MNSFRFANPQWLHLVWAVLALGITLVAIELRGQSTLDRFLSPSMQKKLVRRQSMFRRITAIALFCVALLCLVFALMRPQWGMTVQAETRVDSQIMICLDVSNSMLAEDVVPNRLERAKAEIEALLGLMDDGQQVGLIAFAGKASVLCPMTTDFGFLRLILREASGSSVGLGGTKIGEALGKAVAGFRETGDVNRLVLLITDGEDHDSFPIDASKAAKEKGVRIVSIGFGDEAGSKIEVTDPQTGSRSFVTDREGNQVVSRLDGETLREIALETEGAYIPAGTGALDLESIYDAHIATILKGVTDTQDRIVRNEAYQWCVLLAFLFWLAALLTSASRLPQKNGLGSATALPQAPMTVAVVLFLLIPLGTSALANNSNPAADSAERKSEREDTLTDEPAQETIKLPPRELYNYAISFVTKDPDRAEDLLSEVRSDAGVDGELRFRAIYNLGWVQVNKADALLESEPKEALKFLQIASGRFREAIRVRPDSNEARHNLEVISRRILELTDSLSKKNPEDIEERLDQLIGQQREHQVQLQGIVSKQANENTVDDQAANSSETRRREFRSLGVTQRLIISDMTRLATDAQREIDAANAKPEQESTPQEKLRSAQLSGMLSYLQRSLEWMQKARSFTRRIEGDRAFLRWSASLASARRGRDQLRNPIEVLGLIMRDAVELATLTQQKALSVDKQTIVPDGDIPPEPVPPVPAWLTSDYLQQTQADTTQRSSELHTILEYGVQQSQQTPDESVPQDQATDPEQEFLMENIRLALPLIQKALDGFGDADQELESSNYSTAFDFQNDAIKALAEASEFFYDFRRLIELTYADEQLVRSGLSAIGSTATEAPDESSFNLIKTSIVESQKKNLLRADRLKQLFEIELQKLASAPQSTPATANPAPSDQQNAQQVEQFELAQTLVADAKQAMLDAQDAITELLHSETTTPPRISPESTEPKNSEQTQNDNEPESTNENPGPTLPDQLPNSDIENDTTRSELEKGPILAASTHVDAAVEKLEELRRLFFSLVEHLRETTQRQATLNDDTTDAQGRSASDENIEFGPLGSRQLTLEQFTNSLADALKQQSQTASAPSSPGGTAGPPEEADQSAAAAAETMAAAAERVSEGSAAMAAAAKELSAASDTINQETVTEQQQTALQKLLEALQMLDDAQQSGDDNQEQNQDEQQQQEEQQQDDSQPDDQQQNMNARQMLQAIREREAERRKDKEKQQAVGAGSVEKDW